MELSPFFKSLAEHDPQPIVICDPQHTILYLNPTAQARYAKRGFPHLVGQNLLQCHAPASRARIQQVVDWFSASPENNCLFTAHKAEGHVDLYMIALRDANGTLIGYYEKHMPRTPEATPPYAMT